MELYASNYLDSQIVFKNQQNQQIFDRKIYRFWNDHRSVPKLNYCLVPSDVK